MFAATNPILFLAVIPIIGGQRPITPNPVTDPCVKSCVESRKVACWFSSSFLARVDSFPKRLTFGDIRSSPEAINGPFTALLILLMLRSSVGRIHLFGSGLALVTSLTAGLDALQDGLTVLVELQLGDDDVGGVDAQRDGLAGDLLTSDTLDVNHVLETVDGGDLALLVLVGAADNRDLVILADGDAADLLVEDLLVSFKKEGKATNMTIMGRTLYFSRSSLLSGALMMLRRTLEGASKCALRDLRREEWRAAESVIVSTQLCGA